MRILLNFAVTTMKRGVDTEQGAVEGIPESRLYRQRRPIIKTPGIYMVSYGFSYTADDPHQGRKENQQISVCLFKFGDNSQIRADGSQGAVHSGETDEIGHLIEGTTGGSNPGGYDRDKGEHTNMVAYVELGTDDILSLGLTGLEFNKRIRIRSLYLGLLFIAHPLVTTEPLVTTGP